MKLMDIWRRIQWILIQVMTPTVHRKVSCRKKHKIIISGLGEQLGFRFLGFMASPTGSQTYIYIYICIYITFSQLKSNFVNGNLIIKRQKFHFVFIGQQFEIASASGDMGHFWWERGDWGRWKRKEKTEKKKKIKERFNTRELL